MTAFSAAALSQVQCSADFSPHEHFACDALDLDCQFFVGGAGREESAIPDAALTTLAAAGFWGSHCDFELG